MVDDRAVHAHTVTIHKAGDATSIILKDTAVSSANPETSFTFASAGTYHVWCKNHGGMTSGMHMLVTVE